RDSCAGYLNLGCLALTGPGYVKGIEGTTLHVHCRYDVGYKGYKKYWCRGEHDIGCKNIVGTKGGETVERNGHVSIRDHADDLTMTVTMEDLQEHDAGTYWCKIQTMWIWDELSRDVAEMVKVNVILATTPVVSTLLPTTHTFRQNVSIEVSTLYTRSPLTGLHLLLLVFLKLPVFLSILCAVFWVNR
uniref:Immunoglobulin V-set domain-containing protein n=1 Tax=Cavia porcellus TaxID=10141 RepID=A0A286XIX8_CAVPO